MDPLVKLGICRQGARQVLQRTFRREPAKQVPRSNVVECKAWLKTTAVLKELRDRCEVVPGVTPFMLLQAKALNLTAPVYVRQAILRLLLEW